MRQTRGSARALPPLAVARSLVARRALLFFANSTPHNLFFVSFCREQLYFPLPGTAILPPFVSHTTTTTTWSGRRRRRRRSRPLCRRYPPIADDDHLLLSRSPRPLSLTTSIAGEKLVPSPLSHNARTAHLYRGSACLSASVPLSRCQLPRRPNSFCFRLISPLSGCCSTRAPCCTGSRAPVARQQQRRRWRARAAAPSAPPRGLLTGPPSRGSLFRAAPPRPRADAW